MSKARRQKRVWKTLCDFTAGRLGRRALDERFLARARRFVVRRPTREQAETFRRAEQMRREMEVPRLTRRHLWADFQGQRVRVVRNGVYYAARKKPFHEYLVDHLLWTLGEPWFNDQVQKPQEGRHIVFRWRAEILEETRRMAAGPDQDVVIVPTGNMKSLLVLADDVWQLAQADGIAEWMPKRLGNRSEFQGARYELAVAAAFVRAGYGLEFVEDRSAKAPEFIAIDRASGERIAAVEAKSPRRVGVLHEEPREGLPPDEVRKKVGRLLNDAFEQLGNVDCPALAFVDLNLPLSPGVPTREKPWFRDLEATVRYQLRNAKVIPPLLVAVVVTNFGWHYYRDTEAGDGEFIILQVPNDRAQLGSEIWERVHRALAEYGFIPDPERHELAVEARFPEFGPRPRRPEPH